MPSGAIAYVRQHEALGLGHAVACARRLIADEPFAVILPDDVIKSDVACLKQMVDAYQEPGGNMVAAMEVPEDNVSTFGILDVPSSTSDQVLPVRGMVEKPAHEDAPSNLAVIGRYILAPRVLHNLSHGKRGAGGEIQLTDAIADEIEAEAGVWAFRFRGERYDCGSKAGFLQATVAFGLQREDLRAEFSAFLSDVVAQKLAAQ